MPFINSIARHLLTPQAAVLILSCINGILIAMVVHLVFFAAQGARYTALDGDREENARVHSDTVLTERIDQQEVRISALETVLKTLMVEK